MAPVTSSVAARCGRSATKAACHHSCAGLTRPTDSAEYRSCSRAVSLFSPIRCSAKQPTTRNIVQRTCHGSATTLSRGMQQTTCHVACNRHHAAWQACNTLNHCAGTRRHLCTPTIRPMARAAQSAYSAPLWRTSNVTCTILHATCNTQHVSMQHAKVPSVTVAHWLNGIEQARDRFRTVNTNARAVQAVVVLFRPLCCSECTDR